MPSRRRGGSCGAAVVSGVMSAVIVINRVLMC
jgi:hypothetical protein